MKADSKKSEYSKLIKAEAKRLADARMAQVPNVLTAAVLPASLTELYLKSQPSALRKQWHMWRAARSGRF